MSNSKFIFLQFTMILLISFLLNTDSAVARRRKKPSSSPSENSDFNNGTDARVNEPAYPSLNAFPNNRGTENEFPSVETGSDFYDGVTAQRRLKSGIEDNYLVSPKKQLSAALDLVRQGQYQPAAVSLYNLSRRSEFANDRQQIKYILGLMLMEMKMPQVAAFQFVEVLRMGDSKYSKQAIEKLSLAADILGDETILNYAVSKVNVDDFPNSEKDMLYFRMGEIALKTGQSAKAAQLFSKVPPGSPFYNRALFSRGIAYMEGKQLDSALKNYKLLYSLRRKASPIDTNKVAAQLGIARVLYQKQDWDAAIEAYSLIPRDHPYWHDAFFEQSWAMFRGARFRSAISNFQSLHSTYYEDFYIPESLLLRSIVYLYICKYDEMEKVLNMYDRIYGPISYRIKNFLADYSDLEVFYNDIEKAIFYRQSDRLPYGGALPYIVHRRIMEEGDTKRSLSYLQKLFDEKARIEQNPNLRASSLGGIGVRILNGRIRNTKIAIGEIVRAHLLNMQVELKDFTEQASFIRYEMLNGKKESIKKRIAGKNVGSDQIDEKIDRDFFVKNGFEYYPFQGEYWLDEIGNFHYLGKQSCE